MYTETDPRAIAVLERALRSTSRATRLRAVAMLARVFCERHDRWLEIACKDRDRAVRETACVVASWAMTVPERPWPAREDPAFDRMAPLELSGSERGCRWRWEYTVEVWRDDGLLIGAYLSTAYEADDEHAKRMALGQAILAGSMGAGESFDPAGAAAFIVGKCRVPDLEEHRP